LFPKKYRLRKKWEVKRVLVKGKQVQDIWWRIFYFKNFYKIPRITIIVGKKYHKSAVKRNKLKRKVREFLHHSILSWEQGIDLVIMPSGKFLNISPLTAKAIFENIKNIIKN